MRTDRATLCSLGTWNRNGSWVLIGSLTNDHIRNSWQATVAVSMEVQKGQGEEMTLMAGGEG